MNILAIDIGGTKVKMQSSASSERRKFPSTPTMTPGELVENVKRLTADWSYEAVSIGYPGPVRLGKPVTEPGHLGDGWLEFDFENALARPVKIINDAAMQAVGSYEGGRMLFLGLGTGLGSAMISHGQIEAMELASLPYKRGTLQDYVGRAALKRLGRRKWQRHVERAVEILTAALLPDYVVLGGGNAKKIDKLPLLVRRGSNANAFLGGFRLWDEDGEFASYPTGPRPTTSDEPPAPPRLRVVSG
jgi:polyphosphate glucokinase